MIALRISFPSEEAPDKDNGLSIRNDLYTVSNIYVKLKRPKPFDTHTYVMMKVVYVNCNTYCTTANILHCYFFAFLFTGRRHSANDHWRNRWIKVLHCFRYGKNENNVHFDPYTQAMHTFIV